MKGCFLRGGPPAHPLVYSKRIHRTDRGLRDGEVVEIRTKEGRPCGYGFWHSTSRIALRVLTYRARVVPDEAWLRERVRDADHLRREVLRLPDRTNAWRIAHAEGDGLSGVVVDRYDDTASVSLFSLGWFRRRDELVRVLKEEAGVERVVLRVDPKAGQMEGMHLESDESVGEIEVVEDGVRFGVDPTGGHKTGFFLDQRDNRRWMATLAAGRTVFDGMTYAGGFALAAAKGGATAVRAMDLDEMAIARGRANAKRNDLDVEFAHGDVFDALRALAKLPPEDRPEVVNVDPPKWARDRQGIGVALKRYGDLNRLALEAVRPGGIVFTHSCSGLVSPEVFRDVVQNAARDTRREVRILHEGGAAADHPVSATAPESRYLKSLLLAVGPEGSGPGARPKLEDGPGMRSPPEGGRERRGGRDEPRRHDRGHGRRPRPGGRDPGRRRPREG